MLLSSKACKNAVGEGRQNYLLSECLQCVPEDVLHCFQRRIEGKVGPETKLLILSCYFWNIESLSFFFLALSDHFTLKEKYTKQAGFFLFFSIYFFFLNIYTKEAVFSYFLAILSLHIVVYPVVGRSDECTPNVTHSCNILQGKNVM